MACQEPMFSLGVDGVCREVWGTCGGRVVRGEGLGQWEAVGSVLGPIIGAAGTGFNVYLGYEKIRAEQKAAEQARQMEYQKLAALQREQEIQAARMAAEARGEGPLGSLGGSSTMLLLGGAALLAVIFFATRR